ncbi:hypothetical protein J6590_042446 [Homalodisca vitripennis]|nr:hypothetical protein J6590_042446 [Homalodisca vitripennis]
MVHLPLDAVSEIRLKSEVRPSAEIPSSMSAMSERCGQLQRLSQDKRIKQRRAWLLLGWATAERSCPCKQPACPAIGGGSEVTFKPLVPRLSVRRGFLALTSPGESTAAEGYQGRALLLTGGLTEGSYTPRAVQSATSRWSQGPRGWHHLGEPGDGGGPAARTAPVLARRLLPARLLAQGESLGAECEVGDPTRHHLLKRVEEAHRHRPLKPSGDTETIQALSNHCIPRYSSYIKCSILYL